MKSGTRYIGWGLIVAALVIGGWIFLSNNAKADTTVTIDGVTYEDGVVVGYDASAASSTDVVIQSTYEDSSNNTITVTGIAGGVFHDTDITSVEIPDTVTSIGEQAFQGTNNLLTVDIPSSVTTVGENAFNQSGIQYATVSSSSALDYSNVFSGSDNLSAVGVSGSGTVMSYDGCIYGANGTQLVYVPPAKNLDSADSYYSGANSIAANAFSSNIGTSSTTIPETITNISADAFSGSALETLTIYESATEIGSQANFNPVTIYGNANSKAELLVQWLEQQGMQTQFIVLGNQQGDPTPTPPGTDPTPTPPGTDPTPTPPGGGGDSGGGDSGGGDSGDDGDGGSGDAYIQATDPNTGATTTYIVRGDGSVAVVKDNTPYTADGFDTRYFLVVAFLLAGISVIMFSRSKKLQYVSDNIR